MISEWPCDTEAWSNDAEFHITGINYILNVLIKCVILDL